MTDSGTGVLEGFGQIAGAVANGGEIEASGGMLTVTGGITGTGTAQIGNAATLVLDSSVATGTSVSFSTASGTLKLVAPSSFQGTLVGAAVAGDVIDLVNTAANAITFNGGVVTVKNGSTKVASFGLSGSAADLDYAIGTDGAGGTDITMTADQAPVTTVPGAQTVNGGTATSISGISVSDGDAVAAGETITVVLSDNSGLLAASTADGATVTGNNSTR